MIQLTTFKDKVVALFGLGISGMSAAGALRDGGARLSVYDDNLERLEAARDMGFEVVDLHFIDWSLLDALVLSPGVPLTHPEPHWTVERARAAGVPIIGDTELFFVEFAGRGGADRVIAITGTNGKSTTTALTTHILAQAGEKTAMGGNIGTGVLDLPDFGAGHVYVLEMSSYQIDLTPSLAPTAAGLLNITPDHIDRHGTVEHYAEVKGKIFDEIGPGERAVISIDDPYCREIAAGLECEGEVMFVGSSGEMPDGARIYAGGFDVFENGEIVRRVSLDEAPALRGMHNAQNAVFAYLLASKITEKRDQLIDGFNSFPGLKHRAQEIARYEGPDGRRILFINDSKATNAEASAMALASYHSIYWIAGGRAKSGGIESLTSHFDAVHKVFLVGEAAGDFGKTLAKSGLAFEDCGTIEAATAMAFEEARTAKSAEVTILLSPAAASFDQFANFEQRGAAFVAAVRGLEGLNLRDHID